jgi:hypothetical protein
MRLPVPFIGYWSLAPFSSQPLSSVFFIKRSKKMESIKLLGILLIILFIPSLEAVSSQYCLSPSNRSISAVSILKSEAISVQNNDLFPITLVGDGSYFVLDFGKEVSGSVTISFELNNTDDVPSIGFTYSESSNYAYCPPSAPPVPGSSSDLYFCVSEDQTSPIQAGSGDQSNGGSGPDGPILSGDMRNILGNE